MGHPLTDDRARIAALEAAVAELRAQQDPQAQRDAGEYTWDPRGLADELLVQDSTGAPLTRRKTLQFTGVVTDDPAGRRTVVDVSGGGGGGSPYGLSWYDPFSTDQLATAYQNVTGFTVSGGSLVVPAATSAGAYKTGGWYNVMQQVKVTAPGAGALGVTDYVALRVRVAGTSDYVEAAYVPKNGAPNATLTLRVVKAGAPGAMITSTFAAHAPGASVWLRFVVVGSSFLAAAYSVDPVAAPTTVHINSSAADAGLSSSGYGYLDLAVGVPVGLAAFITPPGWALDDYYVWGV